MVIRDDVPAGVPSTSLTALAAGLARMGSPDLDLVVTVDFVTTIRELTADDDYHDDRNGGSVAARTVPTEGSGPIIVANWQVLSSLTDQEVERIAAHEAGHASIESRGESTWRIAGTLFRDHWWNHQIAYGAAVAIDEFRCEAAVYASGYPTGKGRADVDLADDLFGLNVQLLEAAHRYQTHREVALLRDDVLKVVVFHLRYMGTIAARHLHGDIVDPSNMNRFAEANWEAFVEPTWELFLQVHRSVPAALAVWPSPAPSNAVADLVRIVPGLMASFGYEATEDSFWIRMSERDRQVRLDRANGEADLLGLND